MSRYIEFEGLNNTRDLGGMKTRDGRIRSGKLLRSGCLVKATEKDKSDLAGITELVLDMRTYEEVAEEPEDPGHGMEYMHLPIVDNFMVGVTREKETEDEAILRLMEDAKGSLELMKGIYVRFVSDAFSIKHYKKFLKLLSEDRDKAVLWHCTAGKDRAGFGAVIIQEILGVSRDDIFDDFLKTNVYLEEMNEKLYRYYLENGMIKPGVKEGFMYFWGAQAEYLDTLYKKAEELYGDFNGFLEKGLGVTAEDRERFGELYVI
ncbi:MAG: tyrosine-protein phosphatase [Lachnospiraceae bacterium]|nr:tyrosine-protein phosphatase [Lachnospiraceae bacterium]